MSVALSEVFTQVQGGVHRVEVQEQNVHDILPTWAEFRGILLAALVGGLIGVFIGIIPGTGGAISVFIAYNVAQRMSRHPEDDVAIGLGAAAANDRLLSALIRSSAAEASGD